MAATLQFVLVRLLRKVSELDEVNEKLSKLEDLHLPFRSNNPATPPPSPALQLPTTHSLSNSLPYQLDVLSSNGGLLR